MRGACRLGVSRGIQRSCYEAACLCLLLTMNEDRVVRSRQGTGQATDLQAFEPSVLATRQSAEGPVTAGPDSVWGEGETWHPAFPGSPRVLRSYFEEQNPHLSS